MNSVKLNMFNIIQFIVVILSVLSSINSEVVSSVDQLMKSHCSNILGDKFNMHYDYVRVLSSKSIKVDIQFICSALYHPENLITGRMQNEIRYLATLNDEFCENDLLTDSLNTYYLDPVLNFPSSNIEKGDSVRSKILICLLNSNITETISSDEVDTDRLIILRNTIDYLSGFTISRDTTVDLLAQSIKFSYDSPPDLLVTSPIPDNKYKLENAFDSIFNTQIKAIKGLKSITSSDTLGMKVSEFRETYLGLSCTDIQTYKQYFDDLSLIYSCFTQTFFRMNNYDYFNLKFNIFYEPNFGNTSEILHWYGLNREAYTPKCREFMKDLIEKKEPYLDSDYRDFRDELELLADSLRVRGEKFHSSFLQSYRAYRSNSFFHKEDIDSQLLLVSYETSTCN